MWCDHIGEGQYYFWVSKEHSKIEFYKRYVNFIKPIVSSIVGKAKKAIVLDCDNTLWKGIIGEDGLDGIEMSANTSEGIIYNEIQNLIITLYNKGIIICLCSKNNKKDVEEVLNNHNDMLIKEDIITIKK